MAQLDDDEVRKIRGAAEDVSKIRGAAEDAVTYPILTKEADGYPSSGRNGESPLSFGGSPTRAAQETIRQVLGWRYRGQDTKGFLAALDRAFDLKEVEGHTEWEWKPQNYMVQADLGEITGAQASILTRAKVSVEHALPLLDGLTPLREDADEDEMESVRSIIRNALNELLREFGASRGPRVQRVDSYFEQLLGKNPDLKNPETVGGYLFDLRERFGLDLTRVNTIAEEQNLTNSVILIDYVISLKQTWDTNRKYFDRLRTAEPFLGTQLVLLSQSLEVIAESVHETYDAMDSVFFSAVERQTTDLSFLDKDGNQFLDDDKKPLFNTKPSPMTVAELLGWTEEFATAEARHLIQDSGKDGVIAVRRTLRQLHTLVTAARMMSKEDDDRISRGFHSNRVHRALKELESQLFKAYQLAADVRPAVLTDISPRVVKAKFEGQEVIVLSGEGLSQDGDVTLTGPSGQIIKANSEPNISNRRRSARLDLGDPKLQDGEWVVSFDPAEGPPVTLEVKLLIEVPAAEIKNVEFEPEPVTTAGLADFTLTISGDGFRKEAKVILAKNGSQVKDENPEIESFGKMVIAEFNAIPFGDYKVSVKNPNADAVDWSGIIKVRGPAPEITSVSPDSAKHGATQKTLRIKGKNFNGIPTIRFEIPIPGQEFGTKDAKITVDTNETKLIKDGLETKITITGDAVPGKRHVVVINPDLQEFREKEAFEVE